MIQRDLARTLPQEELFREKDGEVLKPLILSCLRPRPAILVPYPTSPCGDRASDKSLTTCVWLFS